mmetsp:Transcript_41843/g.102558  ORF Transcript_41843/g.102558 Transcript_41843/m.102558 type:complete len:206 (-) Transcript_41843:219-836(-)
MGADRVMCESSVTDSTLPVHDSFPILVLITVPLTKYRVNSVPPCPNTCVPLVVMNPGPGVVRSSGRTTGMAFIARANAPIHLRSIDLAAVIHETLRFVFSATTFMTTMGSMNWLTWGATQKITALPSLRHSSLVSPPMLISLKKRSMTVNQKEHTTLRNEMLKSRYVATHTTDRLCPMIGNPMIDTMRSSPTATHSRRNPALCQM